MTANGARSATISFRDWIPRLPVGSSATRTAGRFSASGPRPGTCPSGSTMPGARVRSRGWTCLQPGRGEHNWAARKAVGVRCSGAVQLSDPPAPKPATGLSASDETTTTVGLSWTLPTQPRGRDRYAGRGSAAVGHDMDHRDQARCRCDQAHGDRADRRHGLQLPHPAGWERRERGTGPGVGSDTPQLAHGFEDNRGNGSPRVEAAEASSARDGDRGRG